MAYNDQLTDRVRHALARVRNVREESMFGRVAFMVNGRMCITAGDRRLLCRIDPDLHDRALRRAGASTLKMRGREYRGFVNVGEKGLRTRKQLGYWVGLTLEFNKRAKVSRKKRATKGRQ